MYESDLGSLSDRQSEYSERVPASCTNITGKKMLGCIKEKIAEDGDTVIS